MTEMECGDIVKLSVSGGKIILSKVDIVEMGSQDPETMEAMDCLYPCQAIRPVMNTRIFVSPSRRSAENSFMMQ